MERQDFLDMLDEAGKGLDDANLIFDHDLREAQDCEEVTPEESQRIEVLLDRWMDFYTEFNILYELAQGLR